MCVGLGIFKPSLRCNRMEQLTWKIRGGVVVGCLDHTNRDSGSAVGCLVPSDLSDTDSGIMHLFPI